MRLALLVVAMSMSGCAVPPKKIDPQAQQFCESFEYRKGSRAFEDCLARWERFLSRGKQ